METLLDLGSTLDGHASRLLHERIAQTYDLNDYTLNQLRYDLRKMKVHGLVERNGRHYTYRLTEKGMKTSALFLLFHKRVCGPLANSLFEPRLNKPPRPNSKLEHAYHKADKCIQQVLDLLAA